MKDMKNLKIIETIKTSHSGGSLASVRKSFNVINNNGDLILIQQPKKVCIRFIELNGL